MEVGGPEFEGNTSTTLHNKVIQKMTSNEIYSVGDIVEYCYRDYGNAKYCGSLGTITSVTVGNPDGYSPVNGQEYVANYQVDWYSGLLMEYTGKNTPFWNITVRKLNQDYIYDQTGDTEEDI
ncbi:hypothetical protein EVB99_035 [Rhizobium phage RHph_N3_19]|nr:hypothetical protein EVB99_035 [Rhizobium phage RHph_N3_19]